MTEVERPDSAVSAAHGPLEVVLRVRRRLGRWASSPSTRRALLLVGTALFVLMALASWNALPERPEATSWPLLGVVLVVLAPLTIAMSALEYRRTARMVDVQISLAEALRVAIASSAANLLPLPGSFFVRTAALRRSGVGNAQALAAPMGVGLTWLASGCLLAGCWLTVTDPSWFSALSLATGLGLALLSMQILRSANKGIIASDVGAIWAIESSMTLISALRYQLVLVGLGYDIAFGQAVALALSSIVATAVGIMPAGLGLREALAGGIAPLVALPAAVGVIGATLNRILGLVALAALSGALLVVDGRGQEAST